jgi:hypothetical protein
MRRVQVCERRMFEEVNKVSKRTSALPRTWRDEKTVYNVVTIATTDTFTNALSLRSPIVSHSQWALTSATAQSIEPTPVHKAYADGMNLPDLSVLDPAELAIRCPLVRPRAIRALKGQKNVNRSHHLVENIAPIRRRSVLWNIEPIRKEIAAASVCATFEMCAGRAKRYGDGHVVAAVGMRVAAGFDDSCCSGTRAFGGLHKNVSVDCVLKIKTSAAEDVSLGGCH